jgi:uncharacterized protein (DUF1810 family)
MIQWLREALRVLPRQYANFYLFCTLTGLRASECVEAVRLINSESVTSDHFAPAASSKYYNSEQKVLQHYRFLTSSSDVLRLFTSPL